MAIPAIKQIQGSELQNESVSSGRVYFPSLALSPEQFDRDLPKFGSFVVRLMRHDAEVHAAIEFLADAIFADGINFVGAAFDADPEFDLSEEIKNFIHRCLIDAPSTPFLPTLKELARGAICGGHKVAEIVARLESEGGDAGKLVLGKLKVKPNRATAFVVDEYYNVIGLVGVKKGQYSLTYGQIAPENVIPKEKFFVCSLQMEDSDPRGVSQLKAAMKPFFDKQETRQQFSIWRRSCAIAVWTAEAPEKAQLLQVIDPATGLPLVVNGVPKTISATQSIAETLAKLQNNTVAVLPFGSNVTRHNSDGTGQQFKLAYDLNNTEIRKSILLQTQATGDADKAGLGSQGHVTHERILGRRVKSFRSILADQIYDLARTFVVLNYGEQNAHLTPTPDFGEFDKSELQGKLDAAIAGGYTLDKSQYAELDSEFGYPSRASDWMERDMVQQQQMLEQQQAMKANARENVSTEGSQ